MDRWLASTNEGGADDGGSFNRFLSCFMWFFFFFFRKLTLILNEETCRCRTLDVEEILSHDGANQVYRHCFTGATNLMLFSFLSSFLFFLLLLLFESSTAIGKLHFFNILSIFSSIDPSFFFVFPSVSFIPSFFFLSFFQSISGEGGGGVEDSSISLPILIKFNQNPMKRLSWFNRLNSLFTTDPRESVSSSSTSSTSSWEMIQALILQDSSGIGVEIRRIGDSYARTHAPALKAQWILGKILEGFQLKILPIPLRGGEGGGRGGFPL